MRALRHLLGVGWVAALSSAFCADAPPDVKLFTITQPILRTNALPTERPELTSLAPVDVALTHEAPIELMTQRYETMTGTPLLLRPPVEAEHGGAYGFMKSKVFDPILDLESVKVGKVHVTGSVVNALKKKNPLCLLNPFVFAVDW